MIDPAIRIVELDPREWKNLVRLLTTPAPLPARRGEARAGGLIVLHAGGRTVKAVHTDRGRLDGVPWEGGAPAQLKALARAQGVRWVVGLEVGALDELMHRVQQRFQLGQDAVELGLEWARVLRELLAEGQIAVHPRPLKGVPIPQASTVARAADLLLPDDRTAVAYLFEGPEIWTSLIVRKSHGQIDLLAGHRALGLPGSSVRGLGDHGRILDAVRRNFGEPHVGFFAERRTIDRLLADPSPGVWARAYATGTIVVEPLAPWAGVVLGADVVRQALDRSRKLLQRIDARGLAQRLDPLGLAQPLARAARDRIASAVDLQQVLGFDPFEVLGRLARLDDE